MKNNILQKINPLCQSGHARLLQLASSSNLSPYILKMNQNLAQGHHMENDVTILSSHFRLNFSKLSCPNGKNVCSFYEACIRMALPKPGGGGAHGGVMIHHIWTTQHNLDQPKKFNHPTQTLVKTNLTNITKVVHNSETVRNIRSIQESILKTKQLCQKTKAEEEQVLLYCTTKPNSTFHRFQNSGCN